MCYTKDMNTPQFPHVPDEDHNEAVDWAALQRREASRRTRSREKIAKEEDAKRQALNKQLQDIARHEERQQAVKTIGRRSILSIIAAVAVVVIAISLFVVAQFTSETVTSDGLLKPADITANAAPLLLKASQELGARPNDPQIEDNGENFILSYVVPPDTSLFEGGQTRSACSIKLIVNKREQNPVKLTSTVSGKKPCRA